jgi:hypothetical protein
MIVGILDFNKIPFVANLEYYKKINKGSEIHIVVEPNKKSWTLRIQKPTFLSIPVKVIEFMKHVFTNFGNQEDFMFFCL